MPPDRSVLVRTAFDASVDAFVAQVAEVAPDRWAQPATDAWTVRQLVAHVVRGTAVMSDLLDAGAPAPDTVLPDAAAYFRAAFALEGIHDGIVQRAVDAAAGAPDDLVGWAREVTGAAVTRAAATPDDEVVVHFAGSLHFVDYLGTRVTELVLHTFELQAACGRPPHAPPGAVAVVNEVLLALADRADPVALALALSGRSGPTVCNVLS